jgi:hypothetical protein
MPDHTDHDQDRRLAYRSEEVYDRHDADVRREVVHERFGGVDVPATLVGALVAMALTTILGAVGGAILGTTLFGGDTTIQSTDVLPAAVVGGLVLALAYFVGGWAAGRVARYNGTRNGVMAAVWTILFVLALAAAATYFGDRYDVLAQIGIPNWLTSDDVMTGGIVGGIAAVVLMVLFAAFGGRRGEAYHDRADSVLIEPRAHGV